MRAILTYHSLDRSGSPISVDPEVFRAQVRWLASGRVRVVPLEELPRVPADQDAVALTFDDGFANFATDAAPALREHGLPATIFVVTGCVGGTNAWGGRTQPGIPTLPLLDWDALGALAEAGFSLGGHGVTHVDLSRVAAEELEEEVLGSAERLRAMTGRAPRTFAYPYGGVNPWVAGVVAEHFQYGCTTEFRELRPTDRRPYLPRLDMYYFRVPGRLERWGTPAFRRYLWLRARARRVRQALAEVMGG